MTENNANSDSRIVDAFLKSIRPLVESMVCEFEVTYPKMELALRALFVEAARKAAAKELDSENVPASVISLKTGLSAKSVRETPNAHTAIRTSGLSDLSRLLGIWSTEPDWQDENGLPKLLQLQGKYGTSNFETLVRKTIGNISYGPVVEALLKSGCISQTRVAGKKAIKLEKTFYVPSSKNAIDSFETGCDGIKALATTVQQNVAWSHLPPTQRHNQGTIQVRNIAEIDIAKFRYELRNIQRRFIKNKIIPTMKLLEDKTSSADEILQAGLGFYYFEMHNENVDPVEYKPDISGEESNTWCD